MQVGFALWSSCPSHECTFAAACPGDASLLVTGDSRGKLMLWRGTSCISVLLSHASPVVFIGFAHHGQQRVIVSCSRGGRVVLCSQEDFSELGSAHLGAAAPLQGACVLSDLRHLALRTRESCVRLLDLAQMREVAPVRGLHFDWVSCVAAAPHLGAEHERRPPVLVSASRDGVVVFWSLQLQAPGAPPPLPVITMLVEGAPVCMSLARSLRTLAIVTSAGLLMVYSVAKPSLLFSREGAWRGCCYDEFDRLVAWDADGHVHVFTQPPSWTPRLKQPSFGPSSERAVHNAQYDRAAISHSATAATRDDETRTIWRSKSGVLFHKAESAPGAETTVVPQPREREHEHDHGGECAGSSHWQEPPMTCSVQLPLDAAVVSSCDHYVTAADALGSWTQWDIETGECVSGQFCDAWTETQEVSVSASALLDLLLIQGMADGSLRCTSVPSGELVWKSAPSDGHRGRVSCVWFPTAAGASSNLFVSGGDDGRIIVWDLTARAPAHVFSHHTGSITHLFGAPPGKADDLRWKDAFFSVSMDRSVGFFSLKHCECMQLFLGHSEEICSVRWREDLDMLIVGTSDREACVWDLGSGLLEQRLQGEAAALVESTCDNLLRSVTMFSQRGPLSARSVRSSLDDPPVQILSLGIEPLFAHLDGLETLDDLMSDAFFHCCSFFLPWGLIEEELRECLADLSLVPTRLDLSPCLVTKNSLTTLTPAASHASGAYRHSPEVSAVALLIGLTFSEWLLTRVPDEKKNISAQLMTLLLSTLPEKLAYWSGGGGQYVEPSLQVLAACWQSSHEHIRNAARALFNASLQRLDSKTLAEQCARYVSLLQSHEGKRKKKRYHAVMVLGILGTLKEAPLEKREAELVAKELLKMLYLEGSGLKLAVSAAELLGAGFVTWSKGMGNAYTVVRRLFQMSLDDSNEHVSLTSRQALFSISGVQPTAFVHSMVELMKISGSIQERCAALTMTRTALLSDSAAVLPQLEPLVDAVVACLDPAVPNLRSGCMAAATSLLDVLVRRFPMVDFYSKQPQYLAVGTSSGVLIYDMAGAVKWAHLKGHKGAVLAVKFAPQGGSLVSYSLADGTIKLWSITSSFFGFGSTPHCTKTVIAALANSPHGRPPKLPPKQLLESVKLEWKTPKELVLHRGAISPPLHVKL